MDGDGDVDDNDLDIIVANFDWSGCPGWINAHINLDKLWHRKIGVWLSPILDRLCQRQRQPLRPHLELTSRTSRPIPHVQSPSDLMSISSGENVAFQWDQLPYPVNYLIYIYDEDGLRIWDSGEHL